MSVNAELDKKYTQLIHEHVPRLELVEVFDFFGQHNIKLSPSDLLQLTRIDCMEYFGQMKGPVYYNRIRALQNILTGNAPVPVNSPVPPANITNNNIPSGVYAQQVPSSTQPNAKAEQTDSDSTEARTSTDTCRNYVRGKCRRGNNCRYSHQVTGSQTLSGLAAPHDEDNGPLLSLPEEAINTRFKTKDCMFFTQGKCQKGEGCPFIHNPLAYRSPQPVQTLPVSTKPPHRFKTETCKFFDEGKCQRGVTCTFLHAGEHAGEVNYVPPKQPVILSTPVVQHKVRDVNGNQVCLFFLQGKCGKDKCGYAHAQPKPPNTVFRSSNRSRNPNNSNPNRSGGQEGIHTITNNLANLSMSTTRGVGVGSQNVGPVKRSQAPIGSERGRSSNNNPGNTGAISHGRRGTSTDFPGEEGKTDERVDEYSEGYSDSASDRSQVEGKKGQGGKVHTIGDRLVFVQGIAANTPVEHVRAFFKDCGKMLTFTYGQPRTRRGTCNIEFDTIEGTLRALSFSGTSLLDHEVSVVAPGQCKNESSPGACRFGSECRYSH